MLKKNFSSLLLVFGMTACLWSCGDDDDSPAATGGSKATGGGGAKATGGTVGNTGGTAGSKATGGTVGNTGGTAGSKATGGTVGNTGGTPTTGGTVGNTGGTAGSKATGGTPTTGGAGGSDGGVGGEPGGVGGMGGGEGGVGGEPGSMGGGGAGGEGGSASAMTFQEACTKVCADQAGLACSRAANCVAFCAEFRDDVPIYEAAILCEATKLTAADYLCNDQSSGPDLPGAKPSSACQTEVCAHQCEPDTLDNSSGALDEVIYDYCGC